MIRKKMSIRIRIILMFIMLMVVSYGSIGYIVFSNWMTSSKHNVEQVGDSLLEDIFTQIEGVIAAPLRLNEVNKGMIALGILDLEDEIARERFFVNAIKTHPEDMIYSFSYGTSEGAYYGARRNDEGNVEIMRNNQDTEGHSWYFSVSEDHVAEELVLVTDYFDPRTRNWYESALLEMGPVFSPVYKHFVMDDLTVSASYPIIDADQNVLGVLGTHMTLSNLNEFLKAIVEKSHGRALIFEKDSGYMIANSYEDSNFIMASGAVQRKSVFTTPDQFLSTILSKFQETNDNKLRIHMDQDYWQINVKPFEFYGLSWMIVTAVPESVITAEINENILLSIVLTLMAVFFAIIAYWLFTKRLFKPIEELVYLADEFASGNLNARVDHIVENEVGRLSFSFNKMADMIQRQVDDLEMTVKSRTNELEESKNQLRLILDSTVESIYGIDKEGVCTFCNRSGLELLGYESEMDLIGKNMHDMIHHSTRDGRRVETHDCKIVKAIESGCGTHVEDEVFWKSDGTFVEVEYYSYPQYRNDEIIGAVVTFMDNSEKKRHEAHIKYLSYHDSLTGLKNRAFFEEALRNIVLEKSLPLSIVFGDVNGLKLTNDIFGHAEGDALLKKTAEVLKTYANENDIVARVGGDEFALILPNRSKDEVADFIERVKNTLANEKVAAIKCAVSIGADTLEINEQKIGLTIKNAEDNMYKDKTINRSRIHSDMIETIITTLHEKSAYEKAHSEAVSQICQAIGIAMGLAEEDVRRLKDAGFLHDIGKIVLPEDILGRKVRMDEEVYSEVQQHSIIGYRILNLFDETLDLAEGILNHHEYWDGTGFPKGLKEKEIPLLARIISVAECYDKLSRKYEDDEVVLKVLKSMSGTYYDPEIIEILVNHVLKNEPR